MKTPDVIYVEFSEDVNLAFEKQPFEETPAYIRKDALLEKLEKVAAEYKKRSEEGELVWQNMCGINLAIDILNKM